MYTPMQLAEAFIKTGELNDALDALNQQLEADPGHEAARRLRAAVLLRIGDLSVALDDLNRLANPTADDHARRSVILERLGDLDGAVAAMEAARALRADDQRLAERHLQLLLAQGRTEQAQALLAGLPATWRWLQWAGDLAAQSGDNRAAAERYSLTLSLIEDRFDTQTDRNAAAIKARLLLARAECYRRLEQVEQAEADYRAAQRIIPSDPLIPFNLGLLAAARGDLEAALTLCRESFAAANDTLRAHMRQSLQEDARYAELAARL